MIQESLASPSLTVPTTLYTALMFIDDISREDAVKALEEQAKAVELKMADVTKDKEIKGQGQPLPEHATAVFSNMLQIYQLHLKFLTDLQQLIQKESPRRMHIPQINEEN